MWLGTLIGWSKPIIGLGITPFLLAEIFKIVLLSLIVTLFNKKLSELRKWIGLSW